MPMPIVVDILAALALIVAVGSLAVKNGASVGSVIIGFCVLFAIIGAVWLVRKIIENRR